MARGAEIAAGSLRDQEAKAPGDYDQLHHFVAAGVCAAPLEKELLVQADKLVGGSDAVLVIDDTAVPKKSKHVENGLASRSGVSKSAKVVLAQQGWIRSAVRAGGRTT